MKSTIEKIYACGCKKSFEIRWDGRSKTGYFRSVEKFNRMYAPDFSSLCIPCQSRDVERRAMALIGDAGRGWSMYMDLEFCRRVAAVHRRIGGTISRSPKSHSLYVTTEKFAVRISDHGWPGEPKSVVRETATCRRRETSDGYKYTNRCAVFTAILRPDWLAVELGGK